MGAKRRIDVMLSSTFLDLEGHRAAVIAAMNGLQLTPLAQEFDGSSDSDLIKSSLAKVDEADLYVGLIGSRYGQRPECPDRNPDRLSLTELEYRHAVKRGLPRLMFIMADNHELTLADLKRSASEGDEGHRLRQAFVEFVRSDRIAAEFSSPADLETKANKSFFALQRNLAEAESLAASPAQEAAPGPDDVLPAAPPAFHYVRKPYIGRQRFEGRTNELSRIGEWATSKEAMLLVHAIGGMGKSMLTWEWLRSRSEAVRGDWAGRLWYSFYEQGADLNDFCVHALAYIRHEPPRKFRGRRTLDLGAELLRELDARPWLLILDGLERVLVAYNRAGKEHMTDEEAVVVRDDLGLDRKPRDCFRPEDADVLSMLAQARRGKLLASSRLTPTALTNSTSQPIPGVMHIALDGLAPEDAESILRNAGVRGDGWKMRHFLDDKFRCHPLSVGVVAGQVMTFLDARGHFDGWLESPKGGADPALIAKDLRGRQNHILARAFDDLNGDAKAFLGSIAMAGIELTPDVLRLLNPMRPIEPGKVDPPQELGDADAEAYRPDYEHFRLKRARDISEMGQVRAVAQENLDAYRKQDFATQKERYGAYLTAHPAWLQKASEADAWLVRTLPNLEARGLLQYDGETGSLDMHPAIRHTALIGLSPEARSSTGSHVSDALSSRPVKPFEEARTRDDLAVAMTRIEALNAAGKLEDGWHLLQNSGLDRALLRLQYTHERLELMQPYFPRGWEQGPILLPEDMQVDALHDAALALDQTGRPKLSAILYTKAINMGLAEGEVTATILGNFANCLGQLNQRVHEDRLRSLAVRWAEAADDKNDLYWLRANQVICHVGCGQLDDAEAVLLTLRTAIKNEEVAGARKAQILRTDLTLAFRSSRLSEPIVEQCLKQVRLLGARFNELQSLEAIAAWRQANGRHQAALDALGDLIALANETGSPHLRYYEARRALSLAALGRREEAIRIAAKADHGNEPPHVGLALLYLELGDRTKARDHALVGYTKAWGEGPPYHDHWDMEDCRKVLAAVGEPEPVLPPFDPSKVEPFDFEPDVERLIEKKLAEKAEEKAKREAEAAKRAMPPGDETGSQSE